MWLTILAVRRPLLILMVICGLLIGGLLAWPRLGVDLLPSIDAPIVVVSTPYPGGSPLAVDGLVTATIERAVAGLNDIDYVQSTSIEGASTVIIFFTERAASDSSVAVGRRIATIRDALPAGAGEPAVEKFDPNAQPIMELTLSARGGGSRSNQPLATLQQIAAAQVQTRLQSTSGVGQVSLIGGREREIQVRVDPARLAAHGLSFSQVEHALADYNVDTPVGSLTQSSTDFTVRFANIAQTPASLGGAMVAMTAAGPVFVRDVATILDTLKPPTTMQRTNGQPAIGILVFKQPTANAVQTADALRTTIQRLGAELPGDVDLSVTSDRSTFTRRSVADVQRELGQAVVVTGLVLLLFLHSLRGTSIVLLAIPTSLVATLGVMYVLGITLNTMSLMGLTLTVGILVDDSIVILENIVQHLRRGAGPRQAAVTGRAEIGFAAIAITLVDVVVFTPIAFMTGVVGQYARPFGLVVVAATLFSLLVSFTLTPLLASRWYSAGWFQHESGTSPLARLGRVWDRGYEALVRGYRATLRVALGRWARWVVVGLGVLSFVGGVSLVSSGALSTEFFPEADTGQLQLVLEMPAATTLELTDAAARQIEQRLSSWPEVSQVFTSVGVGSGQGVNAGGARFARLQVELAATTSGTRSPTELSEAARALAAAIPGSRISANPIRPFGGAGAWNVQVRIQGEDQTVLAALAQQVTAIVRKVPGATDVNDGGVTGEPELLVVVDRARAADLGLAPKDVASVLRTALSGSTVSTIPGPTGADIQVILDPADRSRLEQIADIPVLARDGLTVRLGQIAVLTPYAGPTQIVRRDGQRSVFVTAASNGRPTGDVTRDVQAGLDQLRVPAGYKVTQGGVAENQRATFDQVFQALALSVLLIYMLLVALYENLLYPLIVICSLPLSVVGAFGLLALTGNSLNVLSLIGLILLTGLVGKNAILLVDLTNLLRQREHGRHAALLAAGSARLRPILMTTCALVVAMLPPALRIGAGSEWRAPMAITVIGGLITSTLLTLVLVPSLYTILDDAQARLAGVRWLARLPGLPQPTRRAARTESFTLNGVASAATTRSRPEAP